MASTGRSTQLFIGRLPLEIRQRELEDIFYRYGKLARCDIKYGKTMAYGFVEYEDRRDAEDAMRGEDGKLVLGTRMVVEWVRNATPSPRSGSSMPRGGGGKSFGSKPFGGGGYGNRGRSRTPSPRRISPGVTRRRSLSPFATFSSRDRDRDRFDLLPRDRYGDRDRLGERDRFGDRDRERDRDRFMDRDRDRDRFSDRLGQDRFGSRGSRLAYRSPSPIPLTRRGRFR